MTQRAVEAGESTGLPDLGGHITWQIEETLKRFAWSCLAPGVWGPLDTMMVLKGPSASQRSREADSSRLFSSCSLGALGRRRFPAPPLALQRAALGRSVHRARQTTQSMVEVSACTRLLNTLALGRALLLTCA